MKNRTQPKNAFVNHPHKWQDKSYRIFASIFKIGAYLLIIGLMGGVFIFSYDYLTQCHYFKTPQVDISGTRLLAPKDVLDIAQIKPRANILGVNLKRARQLLLANPWVDEASVTRKIPSVLKIDITEHKPLAIVDLAMEGRSTKYIMNDRGKIFKKWDSSDRHFMAYEIPHIQGLYYYDLDILGQPSGAQFDAAMRILRMGQSTDALIPNRNIEKISLDKDLGLTLHTNAFLTNSAAGVKINAVRIGYEDYTAKLTKLKQLIRHLGNKYDIVEFDLIDMVNLSRITARPIYIKARADDPSEI